MNNDWRALVPPAKHDAVATALRRTFGTTSVQAVAPLAGGCSTAVVLKCVVDTRPYVLRVILHVHALNDPTRQFACLTTAAEAGIGPRVHYADAGEAITITDYIAPVPLREYSGSLLVGLADTIQALHATPRFPAFVNYLDGIDGFIRDVRALGMLPEQATREHFAYYARLQEAYPRHDPDRVSSHNDLNPRNILFDGDRLWLVDWETAFSNDRYADLANAANFFFREEPGTDAARNEEETFLRAYFGEALGDYERARFFLMRPVNCMFYATLLMLALHARGITNRTWDEEEAIPRLRDFHRRLGSTDAGQDPLASPEGQLLYAKVWLNEALHHMRTPRFAESLRLMQ